MAKLTEAGRREFSEAIENLDAVVRLARANFPRTSMVRIETAGREPQASIQVPSYFLTFLIEAGRLALSEPQESRDDQSR